MKYAEELGNRRTLSPDEFEASPVCNAWRRLRNTGAMPAAIEVLKENEKTAVYRVRTGRHGESLIAKRSALASLRKEEYVHRSILANLSVVSTGCAGVIEIGHDDVGWLFLEDVGDTMLDWSDPLHRSLASAWLGRLHAQAASSNALDGLVSRHPPHYLEILQDSKRCLVEALGIEEIRTDFGPNVERLIEALEDIESRWSMVCERVQGLPDTLIHGDFCGKNIRVLPAGNHAEPKICVLDWEMAARGTPAEDLMRVCMDSYRAGLGWSSAKSESLQLAAQAGRALRTVVEISWECRSLATHWPYRSLRRFPSYAEKLRVVAGQLDGVAA